MDNILDQCLTIIALRVKLTQTAMAIEAVLAITEAFEAFDELTAMTTEWAIRAPIEDVRR